MAEGGEGEDEIQFVRTVSKISVLVPGLSHHQRFEHAVVECSRVLLMLCTMSHPASLCHDHACSRLVNRIMGLLSPRRMCRRQLLCVACFQTRTMFSMTFLLHLFHSEELNSVKCDEDQTDTVTEGWNHLRSCTVIISELSLHTRTFTISLVIHTNINITHTVCWILFPSL